MCIYFSNYLLLSKWKFKTHVWCFFELIGIIQKGKVRSKSVVIISVATQLMDQATSVTSDNFPFLWGFTVSPFLCTRIQLTAVPSILCTISLIHIAAYESRQNLSCFAVQQTKQKIAAVASKAVSFITANFLLNVLFHIEWQMWNFFCYFIWNLFCNLDTL